MSAEESLEAKEKLESREFWIPQGAGLKAWLKALCTALLDSGGVKNEALLLSRPLCLVSTWKLLKELSNVITGRDFFRGFVFLLYAL